LNVATTVRATFFVDLVLIGIVTIQIGFSATVDKAVLVLAWILAMAFDLMLFYFDNAEEILRASFDR
jgi:hypothetical protein